MTVTFSEQAMVSHGRVELLAHPLSQKYLQMKWHAYGKYFHLANLLFYIVFLTIVTVFSLNAIEQPDPNSARTDETLQPETKTENPEGNGIQTKVRLSELGRNKKHQCLVLVLSLYSLGVK